MGKYFEENPRLHWSPHYLTRSNGSSTFAAWNTAQQELLALMNRRAQAYANWPSEISKCRSPQDVFEHQTKFVQDLLADWQTSTTRVLAVFSPTQSESRAN
jgi:phasin protein